MSGPKVVRIVTREEVIALCQRQLAVLDSQISAWSTKGRHHSLITEADVDELAVRRRHLQQLLEDGSFAELQTQIASEIEFLEHDMTDRLAREAERRREIKASRRRRRDAANQALAMLSDVEEPESQKLRADLKTAIENEADDVTLTALISRTISTVAKNQEDRAATLSDEHRRLATMLIDGKESDSVAAWHASINQLQDSRISHIEMHLSELELWAEGSVVSEFTQRFKILAEQKHKERSQMQVDSLLAEIAVATKFAKETAAQLEALSAQKTELESMVASDVCQEFAARIGTVIDARDTNRVATLVAEAQSLIQEETDRQDANFRRRAILEGLVHLGYEVREGMETAMASGPIVVNNPATPGYGVEIGGPGRAERMQMRVVSMGAGSVSSRDRDIEAMWCSDVDKLTTLLEGVGVSLAIERATPPGAVPIKAIDLSDGTDADHGEGSTTELITGSLAKR